MRSRYAWSAAALVGLLLAARVANADPLGDLEKAYGAYAAHKYDDAEARLRALLDSKTGALKEPDNVADARMYLGAVLVAKGRKQEANEVFGRLLREKPDYEPDKLRVQLEALDAFIDVHTRLRAELDKIQADKVLMEQAEKAKAEAIRQKAALRLAMLEKLVGEERVVEHNSRWRALLPFGVGQFQNGQSDWGWVFLSSEALLAVGSAVGAAVSIYDQLQRNDAERRRDDLAAATYNDNAGTAAWVADALTGGFLLTAIIGAVHAEVMFVPESASVRKRPLPPVLLAPIVGPTGFGLVGRF